MRRILITGVAVMAVWLAPAGAQAAGPTVILSAPVTGALITGAQPTFHGAVSFASAGTGHVTINIYRGTSATGVPAQVLNAGSHSGAFSATATALADGTYSAQAVATDASGGIAKSQAVTFGLFIGRPQLTLSAPAPPIQTAAPTFTGTALTAVGDAHTADLLIFAGASTDATPVAVLSGAISASGAFAVQVVPGLTPGVYVAVASQSRASGVAYSPQVAFIISSTAASLTVSAPGVGASEPQTGVVFSGTAAAASGDSTIIGLTLYHGTSASGTPLGTARVTRDGTRWTEAWPTSLALGTYTLAVSQNDAINRPATVTHTFQVVPPGSITGAISISAAGVLSAQLSCLSGAGTCDGDVLIDTRQSFRPQYGGPLGRLALMFQRYSVAAGQVRTLTVQLTLAQLVALRKAGASRLEVTVAYSVGAKLTESSHETAAVTVA